MSASRPFTESVVEDTSGGFTHGGWVFPYADEDFGKSVLDVKRSSNPPCPPFAKEGSAGA